MKLIIFSYITSLTLFLLITSASAQESLRDIPDSMLLQKAPAKYLAVFEIKDDHLIGKNLRNETSGPLGLAGWKRLTALFPISYRDELVQFNVHAGDRWAGMFDGDGSNDVNRKGYRLSIAEFTLRGESLLEHPHRPVTTKRGTLDWTIIHEMGHYICLKHDLIEKFSQEFDGDTHPQPKRRKDPLDYPQDGSPRLEGNFVTSYAARNPGDEETVESFTTYVTIQELPGNKSLVAQKIMFFNNVPEVRELRKHVQSMNATTVSQSKPASPKNVLFIYVEDLGYYTSERFAREPNTRITGLKTPHLDKLAYQSVVFTKAFCGQSVCSPSKAAIYTGRAPHSNGTWRNVFNHAEPSKHTPEKWIPLPSPLTKANDPSNLGVGGIHEDIPNFIQTLKGANVYCALSGKLHVQHAK